MEKLREWITNEKSVVWLVYAGVALIVLLPLLLPGYILALDLVFTPHFAFPTEVTNTYPLDVLMWLLYKVLPGDVIEKIVLFLILLLSGVGAHMLIRSMGGKAAGQPEVWRLACYFGGLVYMINPFTYSRFMAGQWQFLLGYALVPFFALALIRFLALPGFKNLVRAALWAFAVVTVSLHHVGILLLVVLLVVALATALKYWRGAEHVRRFFGWGAAGLLGVVALSGFWLIPALLGSGEIGRAVQDFNQADFSAFKTVDSGPLGAVGDVIRLQGFWPEGRGLYYLPQDMIPAWGLLFLALWVLIGVGAVSAWWTHRMVVALSLGCVVLGIILAATPVVEWVSRVIPYLGGYREPHKFASLIALGYAILGAFGMRRIVEAAADRFGNAAGQAATVACLVLPLVITPTMLWGFGGQLAPRTYPAGWYEMNEKLQGLDAGKKTLFLPWHQYDQYEFSHRIIANPAEKFFQVPVVASDLPEFEGVSPTVPNEDKQAVTQALAEKSNVAEVLRQRGIGYVLLAKDPDAEDYSFLQTTPGIAPLAENNDMKLYEVR